MPHSCPYQPTHPTPSPPHVTGPFCRQKLLGRRDDELPEPVLVPDDSPSRQRHTIKMPKHIIPADAIVVNKELGTGEFGVVQQGVWTNEEGHRVSEGGGREGGGQWVSVGCL